MSERPAAIIIGASSGVGRALAVEFAKKNHDLVLLARSERDLSALAMDLNIKFNVRVQILAKDLGPSADYEAITATCLEKAGGRPKVILFPIGSVAEEDEGVPSPQIIQQLMYTNFISVAELITRFGGYLQKNGLGCTIVVFSSIAACVPRKKNVIYASAKKALEFLSESLQLSLDGGNISLQVYALGYVDSMMSFGKKLLLPAAAPSSVAQYVAKNIHKGHRFVYYPRYWTALTLILRLMPAFLLRRSAF
jgi:short-subunit dehydrogenase